MANLPGGLEKLPQQRDVAAAFIKHVGGAEELGVLLHADYLAAPAGSVQRERILNFVMDALSGGTAKPVDQMSDVELEAGLSDLMQELDDGRPADPAA